MGHSLIGLYPWNLHGWFDWDLFNLTTKNDLECLYHQLYPSGTGLRWPSAGGNGFGTRMDLGVWIDKPHWFPVVRDGQHPNSTGVFSTTMRIPYLRWDDHPQYHTESQMK